VGTRGAAWFDAREREELAPLVHFDRRREDVAKARVHPEAVAVDLAVEAGFGSKTLPSYTMPLPSIFGCLGSGSMTNEKKSPQSS
jgi:hypothetical protein